MSNPCPLWSCTPHEPHVDDESREQAYLRKSHAAGGLRKPAIGKTLALDKDAKLHANFLGADWYGLKGLDRLIAVTVGGVSMYPFNALETLITYASKYPHQDHELRTHFPSIRTERWRDAHFTGGLHRSSVMGELPENQQLALYQWAAWNSRLGAGQDKDTGADIKVWDAAPEFVRANSLMQQIIALRSPVVLQECVRRNPKLAWDTHAIALSLMQTGLSHQMPWYTVLDNSTFAQLMQPCPGHRVLGLHKPHLYQFPEDKLPTLQDVHPALFIHGVLHNRTLRESPIAAQWFVPMLEASFKKALVNSSYVNDLITPRSVSAEQAARFDQMLERFAPHYAQLLHVYQSLHPADVVHTKWAKGCARALLDQGLAMELPDLNEPMP